MITNFSRFMFNFYLLFYSFFFWGFYFQFYLYLFVELGENLPNLKKKNLSTQDRLSNKLNLDLIWALDFIVCWQYYLG